MIRSWRSFFRPSLSPPIVCWLTFSPVFVLPRSSAPLSPISFSLVYTLFRAFRVIHFWLVVQLTHTAAELYARFYALSKKLSLFSVRMTVSYFIARTRYPYKACLFLGRVYFRSTRFQAFSKKQSGNYPKTMEAFKSRIGCSIVRSWQSSEKIR